VVLAGLFHPERYTSQTALDPVELVEAWRAAGTTADYLPDVDEIVARVVPELRGGEVVLVMSNGGFGGIHAKLLDALAHQPS
jgi:UDP-N-acetylmuramate: L-alanyl-gamma-D-glutamyl-meso-diaminopimelate ligase